LQMLHGHLGPAIISGANVEAIKGEEEITWAKYDPPRMRARLFTSG
jgi:hypothetical protein